MSNIVKALIKFGKDLRCNCEVKHPIAFRDDEVYYKVSGCNKHNIGEIIRRFPAPIELQNVQRYISSSDCKIPHFVGEEKLDNPIIVGGKFDVKKIIKIRNYKNLSTQEMYEKMQEQFNFVKIGSNIHFRKNNSKSGHSGEDELKERIISKFKCSSDKANKVVDKIVNRTDNVMKVFC